MAYSVVKACVILEDCLWVEIDDKLWQTPYKRKASGDLEQLAREEYGMEASHG